MAHVHHIDARYSKTYATYERAVKEAEAVVAKFELTSTVVFIGSAGDKHDRFAPIFNLGTNEQFKAGELAHNGYTVTL